LLPLLQDVTGFFGVLGILGSEERIVRERIDYNESEKGN